MKLNRVDFVFEDIQVIFLGNVIQLIRLADNERKTISNPWTGKSAEQFQMVANRKFKPRTKDSRDLANQFDKLLNGK